ncbi:MAG TPA: PKD domain-containing protein [Bacteroidia bacterium]|nr:PKD domain-containing protein [Bacteroidia bacterium]
MKNIFLLLFAVMIFASCEKGETGPQGPPGNNNPAPLPVACFSVDDSLTIDLTHAFSFTNCSQNAVRYEWDFDDNTYAPVANPNHVYNQKGNYTVRMTAYNADNISSEASHVITIGNYSLFRLEYTQLYSFLNMPVTASFSTSNFNITDTIHQGDLPRTHLLADSAVYDFIVSPLNCNFLLTDSMGNTNNHVFFFYTQEIVNDKLDLNFIIGSDTTKLSLYYKVIYR